MEFARGATRTQRDLIGPVGRIDIGNVVGKCHVVQVARRFGRVAATAANQRPEICPGQKESGRGENVDLRSPKSGRCTRALHRCEALGLGYLA